MILCIALVALPFTVISDAVSARRRRAIVKRFKGTTKLKLVPSDEFIFDGYVRVGSSYVQRLTNAVADPERLQRRVRMYLAQRDDPQVDLETSEEMYDRIIPTVGPEGRRYVYVSGRFGDIRKMIERSFIQESDGIWAAVPDRLRVATSFIEYLELIGAGDT
jgi:hypothetical protein